MRRRSFGGRRRKAVDADVAADPAAARVAALKWLTRRDFSRAGLAERLQAQGFTPDLVEILLDELIEERLLDDQRFAAAFVRGQAERGRGPRRIRQEGQAAGLSAAQLDAALEPGPDFRQIARDLRRRRFGDPPPTDWAERARQARFLQYRGFSNDHIGAALEHSGVDELLPEDTEPSSDTPDDD